MNRFILMAALLAVCACGGTTETTGTQTQASSPGFPWSGFQANGVTDANGNPECLTLTNGAFSTSTCGVGTNQAQNFGLSPAAIDTNIGVSTGAFTTHQQIFSKSVANTCLGYLARRSTAEPEPCGAGSDAQNDVQYTDGAIYSNGLNLCLNTAGNAWVSCFATNVSWSPINMSCGFDVSSGMQHGTQLPQYLQFIGPLTVLLAEPTGGALIDGITQPNSSQEWCTEYSGNPNYPSNVSFGPCSFTMQNNFMVELLGNPGGQPVSLAPSPQALNVANRQTFAGITDSAVTGLVFNQLTSFVNPTATGGSEQWAQSVPPTSISGAVHLRCNSTL